MDLPQEIDDYIKESIDNTLGLPVSTNTLELKLRASEEINRRLRGQNLLLHSKLKEKDKIIERVRVCFYRKFPFMQFELGVCICVIFSIFMPFICSLYLVFLISFFRPKPI